jgi:mono/diheme cytochrome c family protein
MKTILKRIAFVLLILVLLLVIVVGVGYARGAGAFSRSYEVNLAPIEIPTDQEALANGEYLATGLLACTGCHGSDLSGQVLVDEAGFMTVYAPNLTGGEGSAIANYSTEDWSRSMRHGIRPNGESLIIMPSQFLNQISLADLADIIAYVKSVPAVDHVIPERQIGPVARILIGLGLMPEATVNEILPALAIDHQAAPVQAPEQAVSAEFGEYRALICQACHGTNLSGKPADAQTGLPAAPNLTPGGALVGWSEADFVTFLRTGELPTGRMVESEFMPWNELGLASDDDLQAIWLYLQSLDTLEANTSNSLPKED